MTASMGEAFFYSVARVRRPTTTSEFGWQVMRHDGKRVIPVSKVFLTSAEATHAAERFVAEQKETDA